ncbi:YjbH domain-containing protein [Roseovarius sp. C7]|uniref:YjbH domain-containing protein n=1 Tax=Roseovarius sp. C7 TaxID=3398643 RepID=UPI0039F70363
MLMPSAVAQADPLTTTQTNIYGVPGRLIDMPTAEVAPDAQLSTTVSTYGSGNNQTTRTTLSFQMLPRLNASFRYSAIGGLFPTPGRPTFSTLYDRSFDLSYRFLDEGTYHPAMSIGLRDFAGTNIYSGEYIVATKSFAQGKLALTAGLGWGRLGSYGSFGSTGTRKTQTLGQGGIPSYDRWFRGDVAAFGGVSYQATEKLSFAAEYSSDAYDREVRDGALDRKSPWNFTVNYEVSDALRFAAYSLYGDEVGASVTLTLNPRSPAVKGGLDPAPLPVAVRAGTSAADLGWSTDPDRRDATIRQSQETLDSLLEKEGISLHAMKLDGREAQVQIRNHRYDTRAQALGRTARAMTRSLPASVESFSITLMTKGVPSTAATFRRSDLERLENAPAEAIRQVTTLSDGRELDHGLSYHEDALPRFEYALSPFLRLSVFDPENPVRANAGVQAQAKYHFAPGWTVSGSVSQKLVGNLDKTSLPGASGLPRVRSNVAFYSQTDTPTIDHLTLANYGRPAKNIYSRVTAGYLERMYAGVSGELLWKPVESRLGLGAELNYVAPRDFDQQFGLRTRNTAGGRIPEWNGHVSAYLDMGYGFHGQLDVGRYLAGDWGATVALDRVFANGWRIGAFATKTNVSSDTFGEGSFDKGIRITIPFSWGIGTSSKRSSTTVLRSLTRDGGARLEVEDRLYERVRDTHDPQLSRGWGKFWR